MKTPGLPSDGDSVDLAESSDRPTPDFGRRSDDERAGAGGAGAADMTGDSAPERLAQPASAKAARRAARGARRAMYVGCVIVGSASHMAVGQSRPWPAVPRRGAAAGWGREYLLRGPIMSSESESTD